MQFEELLEELTRRITDGSFINATISQPRTKTDELKRVKVKPVEIKGQLYIQFEYQYERILKHENITPDELHGHLQQLLERFKQIHAEFSDEKIHVQLSKKFKVMWKSDKVNTGKVADLSHNRKKNYLLDENTPYPFLVRLGVQTPMAK